MTKLLTLLSQQMTYLGAKAQVHSENIAKADMPNYQTKDIKPFKDIVKSSSGPRAHNATHGLQIKKSDFIPSQDEPGKEWQIMQLTETSTQNKAIIGLYQKYIGMIKTIIGKT